MKKSQEIELIIDKKDPCLKIYNNGFEISIVFSSGKSDMIVFKGNKQITNPVYGVTGKDLKDALKLTELFFDE